LLLVLDGLAGPDGWACHGEPTPRFTALLLVFIRLFHATGRIPLWEKLPDNQGARKNEEKPGYCRRGSHRGVSQTDDSQAYFSGGA
jgi:hypothetical protein